LQVQLILGHCGNTVKLTVLRQVSLPNQDREDLEQDLKDVVKKVHLRVILKEHSKLKTSKSPASAADAARTRVPVTLECRKSAESSSVAPLIPCAKDVITFQHLGQRMWLQLL